MVGVRHAVAASMMLMGSASYGGEAYQGLFDLSLKQLNELHVNDVVTHAAKWKSKSLDLPFSITFITPYDYYTPFINSIRDVDLVSSSLVVTEFNDVTPQFYIRGVGSNSSGAGDDPSVALLIDGVNIARPGFHNLSLFDIHQVEVIKGAQSSLYGKGVIGGAVNILPNKPEFYSYDHLMAEIKDNGWKLQAINNTLLSEHAANRLSLSARNANGYVENHRTNEWLGEKDSYSIREQLLWKAKSHKVHLLMEYQTSESIDPAHSYHGSEPIGFGQITPYANDYYDVAMPEDGFSDANFGYVNVTYERTTNIGKWVSVTSFNRGDYEFSLNITPIDFQATTNSADEAAWQVSQELRFERSFDDWHWYIGAYISKENVERNEQADFRGMANLLGFGAFLSEDVPGLTDYLADHDVMNGALFMHGQWDFHEDWFVNVGLREDYVEKDFELAVSGGDPFNITLENSEDFTIKADRHWNEFSYSLSVGHYLTKEHLLYYRNSTGFKAGSYNSLAFSPASAVASSEPEIATNNELGLKGFYFNHQLQFNVSVFRTKYRDLQVFTQDDSEANAPKADIEGVDWDMKARLFTGFELGINYSYLNTKFEEFISPRGMDLKNNDLTRAPEHSVALGVSYSWRDLADNHYWMEWKSSYTDSYFITPENLSGSKVSSHVVSNFSFHWKPANSELQYSAWVRNLFDETYELHSIDQTLFVYTNDGAVKNVAPPRSMGVVVSWSPQ